MNWFFDLPGWAQACLIGAVSIGITLAWFWFFCWVIAQAFIGGIESGVEAAKQKKK